MIPLIDEKFRTIRFKDVVCPSKKQLYLRTGIQFEGQYFSGDSPVGKFDKTTLESIADFGDSMAAAAAAAIENDKGHE